MHRTALPSVRCALSIDVPLLLVVITLLVFGLLDGLFSQLGFLADDGPAANLYFLPPGPLGGGWDCRSQSALAWFDYHRMRRLLIPMMGGTIVLLIAVLWVNEMRYGATRSIFGGSIQPSELAKVATIIYLSFWLASKQDQLNNISFGLVPMGAILGFTGGLVLLQPDLSATATIFFMGAILFFLAGGEWRQILFVFLAALVAGYIVVQISATGQARLGSYLDGLRDPDPGLLPRPPLAGSRGERRLVRGGDRPGRDKVHRPARRPHRQHLCRDRGGNRSHRRRFRRPDVRDPALARSDHRPPGA